MISFEFIKNIPPLIWGTILGSSITLFGTWLQGRNSLKLLFHKENIENERIKESRNFEIRKENYISSLCTMYELNNILMGFSTPGSDINSFADKTQLAIRELFKLDLVAEPNTLLHINNYRLNYYSVFMELLTIKISIEELVIDEDSAKYWYKFYTDKINETLNLFKQNPYTENQQQQNYFKQINNQYDDYSKQRDKYSKEQDDIRKKLLIIELELKKQLLNKITGLQNHINDYIACARKDLGLPNISYDPNYISECNTKYIKAMDTFFVNMKKHIDNK